jgi:predicted nucleotidyltransferase
MLDIHALVSSRIRTELLRILSVHPNDSYNINELSRISGFSLRGVDKELKNLLNGGILSRNIVGNQHRYQLNPHCPIYPEIKKIIAKTVGIADVIKTALDPIENEIDQAFIFGSFASGDYGNESDIDLFIVSDISGLRLSEVLSGAQNETGRMINIAHFRCDEFNRRKESKDHFITQVIKGPRIEIKGHLDESGTVGKKRLVART